MDWEVIWPYVWAVLKPAVIAALIALLEILGYDKIVPSRYVRYNKGGVQPKSKKAKGA